MRKHEWAGLIPAGFAFVVVMCAASALTFPGSAARVVVMVVGIGVFGLCAGRYPAALAAGAMGWFFTTGFLVNAKGVLTFGSDDLTRLAGFAVVAAAGCACGRAYHALCFHGRSARRAGADDHRVAIPAVRIPGSHQEHPV
ncbi:hypothetical protein [Nonomuraea rubra]|uniref:Uncharacterized protein n=1 Tax=Nonomuraea rubra TaxID=46180 RepID=A0A7X0NVT6_9ACTN|nr:hypothetical protein [Nonomuraea rubra]MBB6550541.1 hypothetical protein [Nonomuraea rubra]